jgi:Icc-related predicted phosphoesterase
MLYLQNGKQQPHNQIDMDIVHISDAHGPRQHSKLKIAPCDVLICSGDIGGRTTPFELLEFLLWFEKQPADLKIFTAGNHDLCLDPSYPNRIRTDENMPQYLLALQNHKDSMDLIKKVTYLMNQSIEYKGVKFWGSPYSPSFHKEHWAFNADRGEEISRIWGKIPSDVDVLITHTPPFGILDEVDHTGRTPGKWHIDGHVGCEDLLGVIKKRLLNMQLHCFGHIHQNVGVIQQQVSNTRRALFSNGAVTSHAYEMLVTNPPTIRIKSKEDEISNII